MLGILLIDEPIRACHWFGYHMLEGLRKKNTIWIWVKILTQLTRRPSVSKVFEF